MSDEPHNPRWRPSWTALAWIIAAIGVAVRIVHYAWNRSWWIDESMVVLNIVRRSAGELVGRLDLNQAAPPVFLWIERAAAVGLGTNEYALRLFPLLCGIAAVGLVTFVALRQVGGIGALLAAGVMAFGGTLLWHSTEAKPYSSDILVAAILWWLSLRQWTSGSSREGHQDLRAEQSGFSPIQWFAWCVLASLLLWLSYPTVFVIGGVGLATLVNLLPQREQRVRNVLAWLGGVSLTILSFALLWLISIRHQQQAELYAYWTDRFADWSQPWTVPLWAMRGVINVFNYPIPDLGAVLLVVSLAGLAGEWRRRRAWVLVLIGPVLLSMIAGALGQYPFPGKRLTVFLTPAICWLSAAGLTELLSSVRQRWPERRWLGLVVSIVGLSPVVLGFAMVVPTLVDPPHRGNIRPAFEHLRAQRHPGEPVVVLGERYPLQLYATTAGAWEELAPHLHTGEGPPVEHAEPAANLITAARAATAAQRLWIIAEYPEDDVQEAFLAAIESAAPGAKPFVTAEGGLLYAVPSSPLP